MRHLGVNYKTAWRVKHKIMQAMAEREDELRAGTGLDAPLPDREQAALPRRGAHAADS